MTPSPANILVVDDDRFVRELVEIYLVAEGFQVRTAADGAAMRSALAAYPADLVLMDLKLPGEDGLTLTRRLREHNDVGIVILTTRNDAVDRVAGLECGADDYITKPFDRRELLARIRSILRRTALRPAPAAKPVGAALSQVPRHDDVVFHGYRLDPDNATVLSPRGERIALTGNEARLLAHLGRNAGRTLSRDLLMDLVLERERDPLDRSIDVLVTRVRRKIDTDPQRASLIRTVRGSGYMIPPTLNAGAASAA